MIEETLFSKLSTIAATFPIIKEQGTLPAIIYRRVSFSPYRTHSGSSGGRTRYQIDIFSSSYEEVKDLAEEVKTLLELNQEDFEISFLANEQIIKEDDLFRIILDVMIDF